MVQHDEVPAEHPSNQKENYLVVALEAQQKHVPSMPFGLLNIVCASVCDSKKVISKEMWCDE